MVFSPQITQAQSSQRPAVKPITGTVLRPDILRREVKSFLQKWEHFSFLMRHANLFLPLKRLSILDFKAVTYVKKKLF